MPKELQFVACPILWKQAESALKNDQLHVTSSTDSQDAVDAAAAGAVTPAEPQSIYVEVVNPPREWDGSTEHGRCRVIVDGQEMVDAPDETFPIPEPTIEEQIAAGQNYNAQMRQLNAVTDHLDEKFSSEVEIPQAVVDTLKTMYLDNVNALNLYLATHRGELQHLWGLSPAQTRRALQTLSVELKTGQKGMDMADFRRWRRMRDAGTIR